MDPNFHIAPDGSIYDLDSVLPALCEVCGFSLASCGHVLALPSRHQTFNPSDFLDHPDWPGDAPACPPVSSPPPPDPPASYMRPALATDLMQQWDENATTIDPSSITRWNELTYLPGDRTLQDASSRPHARRLQPRRGGFPCSHSGCLKIFDRQCDLKRHQKTHLDRSQRPHKCVVCHEGFLYPKDRDRHQKTHNRSSNSRELLYCEVEGCTNVDGFSRKDNLKRHMRKQHNIPFAAA